jgi:NO-binding membrane sensor protein with MHYT domain/anti-sigma regulatory factor (Ser/Thr protein kinase)
MLKVIYACVVDRHDLRLVALAAFLCLSACFTATNLILHAAEATGRARRLWHIAASIVFGSGVWATHFVAELAYDPGVAVGYDIGLTLLSIVIAMVMTWLGIAVALRYNAYEIGGAIIGGAVGAMHYTGMAALRMPADLHWNFTYVGVSIAIGIVLGAAGLRVLTMGASLRYRLGAMTLLVLAICGLHFTAMAAVVLELNPYVHVEGEVIAPELLAIAIAAVTVLIVALGLSSSFVDDQLARRAVSEAERLKRRVEERTHELHQAQAQLLRQERFSALGELTGTVAHELRNPMSAIANTIFTIRQMTEGSTLNLERPMSRLERSIARCERIINDLVDFSNVRTIQRRPVTLDHWLDEAIEQVKLPEGVRLDRNLTAQNAQADLDVSLMRRAIINLIENASQALTEPAHSPREQLITISSRAIGQKLEITVKDTGIGIPSDVLPKVFEPLFSTRSFGTGLGLSVVKQIVEQHDGTIAIASTPGTGTTVTLTFPRAEKSSESLAA